MCEERTPATPALGGVSPLALAPFSPMGLVDVCSRGGCASAAGDCTCACACSCFCACAAKGDFAAPREAGEAETIAANDGALGLALNLAGAEAGGELALGVAGCSEATVPFRGAARGLRSSAGGVGGVCMSSLWAVVLFLWVVCGVREEERGAGERPCRAVRV